jgi:ATP-dependent DNA helicase RecQ
MQETRPDASALLSSVFGFDGFRPGQAEIVGAVAAGKNVLAIMPTGAASRCASSCPRSCAMA